MQDKATLRSDPSGIQGYTFCRGQASDVPITTGGENLVLQELLRTGIYFCKLEVNLPIHHKKI